MYYLSNRLVPLIAETTTQNKSVLIFCATKVACEKTCTLVAKLLKIAGDEQLSLERINVVVELGKTPVGLDPILGFSIPRGIAYHHSGLTMEERSIIEEAFRANIINVLIATSTLSSGVNLPARRVIFRTPVSLFCILTILFIFSTSDATL